MVKIIEKRFKNRILVSSNNSKAVAKENTEPVIETKKQERKKKVKTQNNIIENKINENTEEMNRIDLEKANNIVDSMNDTERVKRIKSDNGLIERVDINKVVLTEDNKMLLND